MDRENLKHHVANEIFNNFEDISRQYGISQKAAYYAFLGFMPSDTSALSQREIAVIKQFCEKKPEIGRRS